VPEPGDKAPTSGWTYWATWVLAVVLVLLFVGGCLLLFFASDNTGIDETLWSRYVYVFGGLEAIVFTAVGWIFGREVNRTAAETATKIADNAAKQVASATSNAATLTEEAAKGRALANFVRAQSAQHTRARAVAPDDADASPQLAAVKEMADTLFP